MRNIYVLIFILGMVFPCCFGTAAQTTDEIVQKYIAATGGQRNWEKINTIKMSGSMNANGNKIPITVTAITKQAMRYEYTLKGKTGYKILTTKSGWIFNPAAGQTKPEPMPEEQVQLSQDELDVQGDLVDYKAKGNKIVYMGKEDVDGTGCFKLHVTLPSGKEETEYIDTLSFYIIRSVQKIKANGEEIEQTTNFGNFTLLDDGVVIPKLLIGASGVTTIKTVEINKPVNQKIFAPMSK